MDIAELFLPVEASGIPGLVNGRNSGGFEWF